LDAVVQAALETEEEEERLYDEGHKAILEEIGWPNDSIFAFYLQSRGNYGLFR